MPIPHIPPDFTPAARVVGELRICEFIAAECVTCGHCGDVDLKDIVDRQGPWLPLMALARRLRCSRCGGRSRPPRIISNTPRRANHITFHDWFRVLQRGRARVATQASEGTSGVQP